MHSHRLEFRPLTEEHAGHLEGLFQGDWEAIRQTGRMPYPPTKAAMRTWKPEPAVWAAIKAHSVQQPATITITGLAGGDNSRAVSRGSVTIQTSRDPVGAPFFVRDGPVRHAQVE